MIPRDPSSDSDSSQSRRRSYTDSAKSLMQCAERVGNRVFIIMADAYRKPENDIGWRMMYGLDDFHYYVIPLDETLPADGIDGADALEELQLD